MKRKTISLLLVLALCLSCCSCMPAEPVDPETVVPRMTEALNRSSSISVKLVMNMDITTETDSDKPTVTKYKTISDIALSRLPSAGLTWMRTIITGSTFQNSLDKMHYVYKNEKSTLYRRNTYSWYKYKVPFSLPDRFSAYTLKDIDPSSFTVNEEIAYYKGRQTICVDAPLSEIMLKELAFSQVFSLNAMPRTVDGLDYSVLNGNLRIYLNPSTYLPIAYDFTMNGMNEMLDPIYTYLGIPTSVSACTGTATFRTFKAKKISDPSLGKIESYAAMMDSYLACDPDNKDGTFTLEITVRDPLSGYISSYYDYLLRPPVGYEYPEKLNGYINSARLYRDDNRKIDFHYGDYTRNDIASYFDNLYEKVDNSYISVKREPMEFTANGLTWNAEKMTVIHSNYESYYFSAYTFVAPGDSNKDTYVMIELDAPGYDDGSINRDITLDDITELLEGIFMTVDYVD